MSLGIISSSTRCGRACRLPRSCHVVTNCAQPLLVRSPSARYVSFKFFDNLIPEDDPATKEAKEKERRIIKEKMQRSKFAEMFAAQKEKKFIATADVSPPSPEALFPSIDGVELLSADEQGARLQPSSLFSQYPVTLVTVAFQAMGQAHLVPWHEAFLARFSSPGLPSGQAGGNGTGACEQIGLLNVIYLEGWVWKALTPVIRGSMRRSIQPPSLVPHSGLVVETSEKTTDHVCDALGIHNRVMGHAFLVDRQGYIRWRAHSAPVEGETSAMIAAAETLLKFAQPATGRGKR